MKFIMMIVNVLIAMNFMEPLALLYLKIKHAIHGAYCGGEKTNN